MKKLIYTLSLLAVVSIAGADDLKEWGAVKVDPMRGGQNYLLLNDDGNAKARIKPDPLRSGRYLILNRDGNEKGIIRPDPIRQDSWIIEKKK